MRSLPSGWALSCHALLNDSAGVERHNPTSRVVAAASRVANSSGVMIAPRSATRRPSNHGLAARLTPKPATTRSPLRSRRMPASFAPLSIKSLGHFNIDDRAGATSSTASMSARPAASASVVAGRSPGLSTTRVDPKKFPSTLCHVRPCRPRPAVWVRATTQSPSCASVSASKSALVDPVAATIRIVRTRLQRRGRRARRAAR